jgi:cytochrome c oxidase cbb3-type subunit 3/ubiquinol-cytochrome c reductase cytochrome c subunit
MMSPTFKVVLTSALLVVSTAACTRPKTAVAHAPVENGRAIYGRLCATCHGVAGNGYVADNAPSLRSPTFLATATDAYLQAAIMRGRPGTAMGAYARATGGPLVLSETNDVIAFLRQGGPPLEAPPPGPPIHPRGDVTRGQAVYDKLCQRCHGTKTQRVSAVHLANSVLLATASDVFLRRAIEAGRPPTSMVPWKDALTPQQIDDVIAYVRSMAAPPPPPPLPPAAPRTGPIVLNPKGRAPDFVLKDDLYVPIDQVKAALDGKRRMVIGDARSPGEWSSLHIAGAISTPYYDAKALDDIPNDGTWVLAYCACPHHVSGEVVAALRKRGYKHTAVIDEGVFAWQQKGYPVVAAPGSLPPPAPPPLPARLPAVAASPPAHPPLPARLPAVAASPPGPARLPAVAASPPAPARLPVPTAPPRPPVSPRGP